jgi:hypothetical protein
MVRPRSQLEGNGSGKVGVGSLHVVQVTTMTLSEPLARLRELERKGAAAVRVAASMIGALFAGSTLLTPLYVIYKHELGFSQITLTLIYAISSAISPRSCSLGVYPMPSATGGPPCPQWRWRSSAR